MTNLSKLGITIFVVAASAAGCRHNTPPISTTTNRTHTGATSDTGAKSSTDTQDTTVVRPNEVDTETRTKTSTTTVAPTPPPAP